MTARLMLAFLALSALLPAWAGAVTGFSNPLAVANVFQPFQPGGVKVFNGKKDGKASVIVDLYLTDTRTFHLEGTDVPTRILQETEFSGGELIEVSNNYFAQGDDGGVYYFGELVDAYEHGVVTDHEGSWLVGGPTEPTDPAGTANASVPAVFMPADPAVGDVFKAEDLFPIVDETVTVKGVGLTVGTPAGRFRNAIRVVETTRLGDKPETKWYAPGVGVLRGRTKGESFRLIASTLRAP